jgi:DNA-binding transcriptional LysR family regulator
MEMRKLRHFVVLAEELHFGRAARRLALTQPPLSMSIRGLEEELGVPLFERTRRNVALTHAGTVLLEEARAILDRTARAVDLTKAAYRGEVGRLTVGFIAASAYTLLPLVLREFGARFPGVSLQLRELVMPQQLEALRRAEIDVGLLRPPVADTALASEVIHEEPMIVALPAGHPLAKRSRIPAKKLAAESFVMFPREPGLVFHDLIMDFCRRAGFVPRVAQEASQTHAVVGLVSAGLGIALVPESVRIIGMRGVVFRPVMGGAPIARTALAWQARNDSPLLRGFLDTARDAVRRFEPSGRPAGRPRAKRRSA